MRADPQASTKKWLKIVFSVFLLYHLFTVLLMPIGGSLAGRKLGRFVLPYANTLGFNTTWQFFSPGPSPMFYLEYDVETDVDAPVASEPKVYPPARQAFAWDDGWNRRLYGMRFFALNPERLERYFIPFLCRENPGARGISVQAVFEKIDDLDRAARTDTLWNSDFKDLSERIDLPRQKFSCAEGGA